MDLDNLGGNGVGAGALPPVAAGGVGGFLFGAAGENSRENSVFVYLLNFRDCFYSCFVSKEFY